MPDPLFRLQLVDDSGAVVTFKAGGAVEANLVDLIVEHVISQGTITWRTKAKVKEGVEKALYAFKRQSIQVL